MNVITAIEQDYMRQDVPEFRVGDTVKDAFPNKRKRKGKGPERGPFFHTR